MAIGDSVSTDWSDSTSKSTNWGSEKARDFSTGYLLLQNGDYILLQNSTTAVPSYVALQ